MPPRQTDLDGISEAQLRAVFDSIPTRIALLDRDRRYRYVNREYIEFAGLPADRIIGRTIPEVLAEEAFAPFYPQGELALTGEIVPWEGWLAYRQGRRYVQRICVPLRDIDGAVDGYFIFNRDLTELKQGEQALAEQLAARAASEALNTAIIASALDCVIAIDEAGKVVEFNPAAEQTFGYRRADVLNRTIGDLIVPPALRDRHADGFASYVSGGSSHIIGRRIEIEAHAREWRDISRRTDGHRGAPARTQAVHRASARPHGGACGRGGDRSPARGTAPKREDGGTGLAARRRGA